MNRRELERSVVVGAAVGGILGAINSLVKEVADSDSTKSADEVLGLVLKEAGVGAFGGLAFGAVQTIVSDVYDKNKQNGTPELEA